MNPKSMQFLADIKNCQRIKNFDAAIELMRTEGRFDRFMNNGIDIETCIGDARDWILDNPRKGAKKNYVRFMINWLQRARDDKQNKPQRNKPKVGDFSNAKLNDDGEFIL